MNPEAVAHQARVAEMRTRWGTPERISDVAPLLALLGSDANPSHVVAFLYDGQAAADAYAEANLAEHGHRSLGFLPADGGKVIGVMVLDLSRVRRSG